MLSNTQDRLQDATDDAGEHLEPVVRVAHIIRATCEVMGVSKQDIVGRSKQHRRVDARHLAMTVAVEMTGLSLPNIASRFGGRDHTTILSAVKRTELREDERPDIAQAKIDIAARAREIAAEPPKAIPLEDIPAMVIKTAEEVAAAAAAAERLADMVRVVGRGFTPKGLAKRYDLTMDEARVAYERALMG